MHSQAVENRPKIGRWQLFWGRRRKQLVPDFLLLTPFLPRYTSINHLQYRWRGEGVRSSPPSFQIENMGVFADISREFSLTQGGKYLVIGTSSPRMPVELPSFPRRWTFMIFFTCIYSSNEVTTSVFLLLYTKTGWFVKPRRISFILCANFVLNPLSGGGLRGMRERRERECK